MVIFGAGGDLTKRLLVPSLHNLRRCGLLPDAFAVLGVARGEQDDVGYRRDLGEALKTHAGSEVDGEAWRWLAERLHYLRGDFSDETTFQHLRERLDALDAERGTAGNALFYLATPPVAFAPIVGRLASAGLLREAAGRWRRVIVEKPFGTDLASAKALNRSLLEVTGEPQIFRIDHYLGKETVQNIMALRFGNGIFEPLWNRDHIDHVQVTVAETVTVERRGKFYDATGALRDMVPNHVFQLLAMTAMEPPNSFHPDAVRTEKEKVLDTLLSCQVAEGASCVVRGQYVAGVIGDRQVGPYREEPDVDPHSTTETFVAMRLALDNWRWAGVPFYLRTGKALGTRRSEIAIKFKHAPFALFRQTPVERLPENFLVLRIQPEEGISLRFNAKVPGPQVELDGVQMVFRYQDRFKAAPSTGYETLLYDCMIGDATLFQRADNIEAGWRVVQPILDAWRELGERQLWPYRAGSDGPVEADELLRRDGRAWLPITADDTA